MDCRKKWLVVFDSGETQLVSFDRCNNTGAIDVKMDGSVLCLFVLMMKNAFIFISPQKSFFLLTFWSCRKKRFD